MSSSNDIHSIPYSRPRTPRAHPQVGFCGLGAMGYFMARNLANHIATLDGGPLLVYNRTTSKAEKLVSELGSEKVKIAASPGELAMGCDIIITCLASDAAVKSTYEEFVKALGNEQQASDDRTKIFVESSTIDPSLSGELDAMVSKAPNAALVSCPVFGRPQAADGARLILVMSGDHRAKKELAYLLVPAVGRKVVDLGENIEKAPTFKLIGNAMILGSLEVLAECMTLAEKSGIGSHMVNDLINDMPLADALINYGDKMSNDKFDGSVGFAINGGIKDATHIHHLTDVHNTPMPAIDAAYHHLITARALHTAQKLEGKEQYEVLDWSAMIAGQRVAAGLDPFDSQKHISLVREG